MFAPATNSRLAFGRFELDAHTGELWRNGFRIKLQNQPTKVLLMLLEHPGQVVSRENLQQRIWGPDLNVDFDHSLGTAINKIREALGDSADNPRFVETLARRGYRFIAPVQTVEAVPNAVGPAPVTPFIASSDAASGLTTGIADVPPDRVAMAAPVLVPNGAATVRGATEADRHGLSPWVRTAAPGRATRALFALVAVSVLTAGFILAYHFGRHHAERVPVHILQLTHNGHLTASVVTMENLAETATDGVRVYATLSKNGRAELAAFALPDGAVTAVGVPDEVASPALGAISPDGSQLVLRNHLSPESEQPLWIVPTAGGSARRVGDVLAHDATWMPDGSHLLYANENRLFVTTVGDGGPALYATLPGRAFWLRWSPDGSLLRFTIIDPLAHTLTLWQLSPQDRNPVQLLTGFQSPATECCGVWSRDGRWFIFQSSFGGNTNLWRLARNATDHPERITDGPLQFQSPVASRNSDRLYFLGGDARSELDRLGTNGELIPESGFLADAMRVDYARDGGRVAWTDIEGRLWCARADGTERLQLTPDDLDVFMARWSPDGAHLALMARTPGKAWNLYAIGVDGSNLHPLMNEPRNAADPSWSPNGQTIVFGRTNDEMGKENARSLELFDLRSGAVSPVPGGDGLFSPRWSPDGRYIVALSLDQRRAMLFDVATQTWHPLPVPSAADPVWSTDSRSLFVHASLSPEQPIERVSVPDGRVVTLARLGHPSEANAVDYVLSGLAADGTPLIRTRVYTGDLFAIDLPQN